MFLQCIEYSCGPLSRALRDNRNQRSRRVHSLTQDIECTDTVLIDQVHLQITFQVVASCCYSLQQAIRPKAFANSAQGCSASDNPGYEFLERRENPERVRRLANPFRVYSNSMLRIP